MSPAPPPGDGAVADLTQPGLDLAGLDLAHAADLAHGDAAGPQACDPGNVALGANGGPDVCAYGQVCDGSAHQCVAVQSGSCAMVGGAPTWEEAGKAAPVIATISATLLTSTDPNTECENGDPAALVTIVYYAPMTLTTATTASAFLPQVQFKKSTNPGDPFFDGTFMRVMPQANQTSGSFEVGINCGGATGVREAGMYILDGGGRTSNPVCVSW